MCTKREYAKMAFNAAKEGKIEKIPVLNDQYGGVNIEEHFVPNKYKTFEDWEGSNETTPSTAKEVEGYTKGERDIELIQMQNEIWQRIIPVIGSGTFSPLLIFESTPIIGKYTGNSFAAKIVKCWNEYDTLKSKNKELLEALKLAHKNLQGQEAFLSQIEWDKIETAISNNQ